LQVVTSQLIEENDGNPFPILDLPGYIMTFSIVPLHPWQEADYVESSRIFKHLWHHFTGHVMLLVFYGRPHH